METEGTENYTHVRANNGLLGRCSNGKTFLNVKFLYGRCGSSLRASPLRRPPTLRCIHVHPFVFASFRFSFFFFSSETQKRLFLLFLYFLFLNTFSLFLSFICFFFNAKTKTETWKEEMMKMMMTTTSCLLLLLLL